MLCYQKYIKTTNNLQNNISFCYQAMESDFMDDMADEVYGEETLFPLLASIAFCRQNTAC